MAINGLTFPIEHMESLHSLELQTVYGFLLTGVKIGTENYRDIITSNVKCCKIWSKLKFCRENLFYVSLISPDPEALKLL